jgi:hypothetical protein
LSFLRYDLRILSGMTFEKFTDLLDRAHRLSGKSKAFLTRDMLNCAVRFGAGYYDYVTFGFWALTDAQRKTYVTRVVAKKLVTALNDSAYENLFNDKAQFNTLFKDFIRRDWINFKTSSKQEVRTFIAKHPRVFSKPAHGSCGHGCEKLDSRNFPDFDAFYKELKARNAWLLEEILPQHPENEKFNASSMNCLRLITLLDSDGAPHCIFATQKFGVCGRVVDNYGFGCRVDLQTGKICSPGVSGDGSLGIVFSEHPNSHLPLMGHTVPYFFEAVDMVKRASLLVPRMRYIGWDVGITPDGPAIVEGNNYCAHDFWQLPAQTPEKTGMLPVFQKYVPEFRR